MNLRPFTPDKFKKRVFTQLWMLALQYILGMILNLIGAHATGTNHTLYIIVLVIHILNAIGLVEGAFYIALKQKSSLAWRATGAMSVAFLAGIATAYTGQEWWSFVMALGFLGASWLNVMLYIHADRLLQKES